jgi:hypothetical protein
MKIHNAHKSLKNIIYKAMTTLKQVTNKLLDAVSASTLAPIALKIAAKYNDGAVTDTLRTEPTKLRLDDEQKALFASSDKAFVDSFVPSDELGAIADEVAFEVVEEFNK